MKLRRHILPALAALALASCSDTLPFIAPEESEGATLRLAVEPYVIPSRGTSASRADDNLLGAANETEIPQANEMKISNAMLIIYPYSLNDNEHLTEKITQALYFTFPDQTPTTSAQNTHVYTSSSMNISGGYDDETIYYCLAIANCGDLTAQFNPGGEYLSLYQLKEFVINRLPYTLPTENSKITDAKDFIMSSINESELRFHRMGDGTFKFVTKRVGNSWVEEPIRVQRLAARVEFSFGGLESNVYTAAAGYGFMDGTYSETYTPTVVTYTTNHMLKVAGTIKGDQASSAQIKFTLAENEALVENGAFGLKFKMKAKNYNSGGTKPVMTFYASWDPAIPLAAETELIPNSDGSWTDVEMMHWGSSVSFSAGTHLTSITIPLGSIDAEEIYFDDFLLYKIENGEANTTKNYLTNGDFETEPYGIASWVKDPNDANITLSLGSEQVPHESDGDPVTLSFTGKGIVYPVINEDDDEFTNDKFLLEEVSVKNVLVPDYGSGGGTYAVMHRAKNVYKDGSNRELVAPEVFGLVGFSSGYPTSWIYTPEKSGDQYFPSDTEVNPASDYYTGYYPRPHQINIGNIVTNNYYQRSGTNNEVITFTNGNYFTSYYTRNLTTQHAASATLYPKTSANYYLIDYLTENMPVLQGYYTYLEIKGKYYKGGLAATGDNVKDVTAQTLFLRHYANAAEPTSGIMKYAVVRNTIYRLSFRVFNNTLNAKIRWYYYAGESNGSNGYGFNNGTKPSETDYWPTDNNLNGKPKPGDQGSYDVTIYEATNTSGPAEDLPRKR